MGMPIEVRDRWVAALRSGEYKQGRGSMLDEKGRHCCLGVLCDVLGREPRAVDGHDGKLNAEHYDFVYGDDMVGEFAGTLAAHNDQGSSFDALANYIEQHVKVVS